MVLWNEELFKTDAINLIHLVNKNKLSVLGTAVKAHWAQISERKMQGRVKDLNRHCSDSGQQIRTLVLCVWNEKMGIIFKQKKKVTEYEAGIKEMIFFFA